MDDKLSAFLEENLIYSTKDIISNYVKTKEYKMAKLGWFFSNKEEYVDYICVSHDYADNEYLCNEETIIQFIDYLKFNKSKWKSYHIDNKRYYPRKYVIYSNFHITLFYFMPQIYINFW